MANRARMCARGLIGIASCLTVLVAAPVSSGQSLQVRVDHVLADPSLKSSRTGVVLIDAGSGRTLASHKGDELFIPASNMKLITSGVALLQLGADFVFRTELVLDESFVGSDGSVGRVILRGSGDPGLGDPKLLDAMNMTPGDLIDAWVDALTQAGVTGPIGELVIDDRIFDRQFVHPTWPVQQLNRWYCAEVSGLNFHTNLLLIFTEPKKPGLPPLIRTEPSAPWLAIRNRANTIAQGNHTAWAARPLGTNDITLHGDVRWSTDPVELALSDNAMFAGRLLERAMSRVGMKPGVVRLAGPDEQLTSGRTVHVTTTDLATVLRRCNADSYNLYAECLIKRLGYEMTRQPGSWSSGAALERMVLLEKVGPMVAQSIMIADGSGMSRENRVTPRLLAEWLLALHDEPQADAMRASLASAGAAEGTLRKRFRTTSLHNEVRAKTGYLTGVSALSGYVRDPVSQRTIVFSIITNDKPSSVRLSLVRQIEEHIVKLADDWLWKRAERRAAHGG